MSVPTNAAADKRVNPPAIKSGTAQSPPPDVPTNPSNLQATAPAEPAEEVRSDVQEDILKKIEGMKSTLSRPKTKVSTPLPTSLSPGRSETLRFTEDALMPSAPQSDFDRMEIIEETFPPEETRCDSIKDVRNIIETMILAESAPAAKESPLGSKLPHPEKPEAVSSPEDAVHSEAQPTSIPEVSRKTLQPADDTDLRLADLLPDHLRDLASKSGLHADLNSLLVFSAVACVAGRGYACEADGIYGRVSPSIYLLIGTPPAFGKSRGLSAIYAPVYELERESIEKQKKDYIQRGSEKKMRKWGQNDIESLATRASSEQRWELSRDHTSLAVEIENLERKLCYHGNLIITEATPRGLIHELWGSPDTHMTLAIGDARSFLGILSRDASAADARELRQILLNGYGGDRIASIRAGGLHRRLVLEDPKLNVLLMGQTDAVATFLSRPENVESGLVSRFLTFFFDKNSQPPRQAPAGLMDHWRALLQTIYRQRGEPGEPVIAEMDQAARDRLNHHAASYRKLARPGQSDPRSEAFWTRATENLQRLSLVRALMELQPGGVPKITAAMVDACDLLLQSAGRHLDSGWRMVADVRSASRDVALLRKALESVENKQILLSDLSRHKLNRILVERLCIELPDLFEIVRVQTGSPGQPPKAVVLKAAEG